MSRYTDQACPQCSPIMYGWRMPTRAAIPVRWILCDACPLMR